MNVTIFFTRNCNLACSYCYEGEKFLKEISDSVLEQIIVFIKNQMKIMNNSRLSITTHGGEPFLVYNKIKKFVKKIRADIPNVEFSVTTNGTILTDAILNFIINEYKDISVSIDGNKQSHNINRVFENNTGSYDIVMKNSLKILEKRPDLVARMTVNKSNVKFLFNSVKELYELGFTNIMPIPDEFSGKWDEDSLKELYNQCTLIINYISEMKDNENIDIGFIDNVKCKMKNADCDGGITTFTIDTDGKIYPCIIANGQNEFCIGDIFKGIDNTKLKEIHLEDKKIIEECEGCKRYNYCKTTRCKIINKIKMGDFNKACPVKCNLENISVDLALYKM